MNERQDYFDIPAVSQSEIKRIISGVTEEREDRESFFDGLTLGSAVDVLLTGTQDEYLEEFYVYDGDTPSQAIISIVSKVYKIAKEREELKQDSKFEDFEEDILRTAADNNYLQSYKRETRLTRIVKEGKKLFDALATANGRKILSTDYAEMIWKVVKSCYLHPNTRDYFTIVKEPGIEGIYQKVITFEIDGIKCKAMLDLVLINKGLIDVQHGNILLPAKSIMPIDIKTTGDHVKSFYKSARRFRYDIQAAWYTKACESEYPDYNILPFQFLVESTVLPGEPRLFKISKRELNIATWGAQHHIGSYTYKNERDDYFTRPQIYDIRGYMQGIEEMKYYREHGQWKFVEEEMEKGGVYQLELYGE